ncbi:hypothetical protein ACMX25_12335 [Caballeronia sp. 15715]|uniref:hypothetical protein n=1 Tax=Caballeronia sp. 15715 TaxID=3391030 RepID=UPI0039E4E1A5
MDITPEKDKRWNREQVSVWLPGARKARLLAVAAQMAPGAGPKEAIDRAIDLASSPVFIPRPDEIEALDNADHFARLEAKLVGALALSEHQIAKTVARLEQSLVLVAARVGKIHAMITAAANESLDASGFDAADEAAALLPDWLAKEQARLGLRIMQAAVIRASWQAKTRSGDNVSSMIFRCELVAVDGVRVEQELRSASLARLDSVPDESPFSRLDASWQVCFVCKIGRGHEWIFDAHPVDGAGNVGALLGSLRV